MDGLSGHVKHAAIPRYRGTRAFGGVLVVVASLAWVAVVRADAEMQMAHGPPSFAAADALSYTLQWGVMMTAMMLPSAAPMILLYHRAALHAGASQRLIRGELFGLTYVVLWMLTGLPTYLASVAAERTAASSPSFAAIGPYLIAATLFGAGVYQLTPVKHACLRACEAPADFLMRRWRGGYVATLRLAAAHAAYCIGCCWALMVVLVVGGAMSLPWVLTIAVVVFAEKVLPAGGRTARIIGLGLIAAAIAVAVRPELASALRPMRMH